MVEGTLLKYSSEVTLYSRRHVGFWLPVLELLSTATDSKSYTTEVKLELENLPDDSVDAVEFRKYAERLDLAVDRATNDRLFHALTLGMSVL